MEKKDEKEKKEDERIVWKWKPFDGGENKKGKGRKKKKKKPERKRSVIPIVCILRIRNIYLEVWKRRWRPLLFCHGSSGGVNGIVNIN